MTERLFDGQAVEVNGHWLFTDSFIITPLGLEDHGVKCRRVPANKNGNFIVDEETGTIVGVEVTNTRQVLLDAVGAVVR